MGPFSKGGRQSAVVSHADNRAIIDSDHHSHSPLHAMKRMGERLKPHTAITTTEDEPGLNDHDVAAGTAVPIAHKANKSALNAGHQHDGRRSFSSFRSFRSRSNLKRDHGKGSNGSMGKDGTTGGGDQHALTKEQREAQRVADNPQNMFKDVGNDQSAFSQNEKNRHLSGPQGSKRIANTRTSASAYQEQSDREKRVIEHLQKAKEFKQQMEEGSEERRQREQERTEAGKPPVDLDMSKDYASKQESANGDAEEDAPDTRSQSPEFMDAPEHRNSAVTPRHTAQQPTAAAAGLLSPRNRFVGVNESQANFETPASSIRRIPSYKSGGVAGTTAGVDGPQGGTQHSSSGQSTAVDQNNSDSNQATGQSNGQASGQLSDLDKKLQADANNNDYNLPLGGEDNVADADNDANSEIARLEKGGDDGNSDEEDSEDDKSDESLNIPEGGVPGLGVGDGDPGLPGQFEKKMSERKAKKEKLSKNLEDEKVRQKYKPRADELRHKRRLQAEYVGWRQIGGWDKHSRKSTREESEDLLNKSTLLESYVSDKYLGDWYQNTAIIVVSSFFAWLFGRFGMSVSWLSIVLLFTATAYRASVRRMRRNYRDDILRDAMLEKAEEQDSESMEWLNSFLIKFWLIYEPTLSQMITDIGNEVLEEQTPGFIKSMAIDSFTLGTKAPRIDFVRSFPRTDPQVVVIDMGASFTPNETMDLTARQLQTKVNPKVQLGVRIGKGFISKHLPVLLEDMNFRGRFRLRMRLIERAPHIQTVDFSFLEPPMFDFVLKPIGGDRFGFDINIIPGLSKFIKDMVNANLGPMFYAPNAFQINVEQLLAGVGVNSGVGVLSVRVIGADSLTVDSDGRVDPLVKLLSKNKRTLGHTKIKSNTTTPVWDENVHVIVTNSNDNVLLQVLDFNEDAPDRIIGAAPIKINEIQSTELVHTAITSGGRQSGNIRYVAHYAPVTMPKDDDKENRISPQDTKSGILNIKVLAARNLDPTSSKTALLSPFAELEFNGNLIDSTKIARDTNNPEWNYGGEHIVLDKQSCLVTVRIRDNRSAIAQPPQVGLFKIRLSQLLVEGEKDREWFTLDEDNGEIHIVTQWKPANIQVGGSTNNYVEPIGVIRLNIIGATNLRNLEHIGKIDPYARVFLGRRLIARTEWFKNELNPVWNEILYIPVQSELQDITVEVMDVEKHARDRSLGAFKISLKNIIERDENDNYRVFISDKKFTNRLVMPNRGPKGDLDYTIEFYPAIPIVSPEERERLRQNEIIIKMLKSKVEKAHGDYQKALTDDERKQLAAREERMEYAGVDMPIEDLLQYHSGVFAFAIVSLEGQFPGQSIRAFVNNGSYPIYTSPVFTNNKRFTSEECPDFVSGQMDLSSIRFEIGTFGQKGGVQGFEDVDVGHRDEVALSHDRNASEIIIPCRELIAEATLKPKQFTTASGVKIELQARFFPLPGLVIDENEDIGSDGSLQVYLKRATGVRPADPTGLSDPYTAFYLNHSHDRVYKSQIIKETLDPVWEESFRFDIQDYPSTTLKAMIYDWDMGNSDDFLGGYTFDLSELEPLVWKSYEVPLENIKKTLELFHSKEATGTLELSLRFLPGHLHYHGDRLLVGAPTAHRAAGGLVGMAGGAEDSQHGVLGQAVHAPHHVINKITHHHDDEEEHAGLDEDAFSHYTVTIESVQGIENVKSSTVQIRCFLLGKSDKELYRSGNIRLENGEAEVGQSFGVKSLPDSPLGVKLLSVKSLHRHSDIGQSQTELNAGLHVVSFGHGAEIHMSIDET